jgi:hypothetical protein
MQNPVLRLQTAQRGYRLRMYRLGQEQRGYDDEQLAHACGNEKDSLLPLHV